MFVAHCQDDRVLTFGSVSEASGWSWVSSLTRESWESSHPWCTPFPIESGVALGPRRSLDAGVTLNSWLRHFGTWDPCCMRKKKNIKLRNINIKQSCKIWKKTQGDLIMTLQYYIYQSQPSDTYAIISAS